MHWIELTDADTGEKIAVNMANAFTVRTCANIKETVIENVVDESYVKVRETPAEIMALVKQE